MKLNPAKSKKSTEQTSGDNTNTHANVAGVGVGTLVISLSKNIPDHYEIKSWIVIAAPAITILVSYIARRIDIYFKMKKAEVLIQKIKNEINDALSDPYLNPKDRDDLLRTLKEINMAKIDYLSQRIKSIHIDVYK